MKTFVFLVLLVVLASPVYAVSVYSDDGTGTYLGQLGGSRYDSDSTSNPYGQYGSKYSPTSINNPYGKYGSPYSPYSPNNPYATHAPKLYDNDR